MEQENTNQAQSVPGTPLRQISQDRFNQLRIPQSPSVPAYLNENVESHSRRGSDAATALDVKSKIAFLNSLANSHHGSNTSTNSFAIAASPTRSPIKSSFNSPVKSHSRANSAFSIPSDPSDLTNLVHTLHAQLEQSRNRERLVAERVESMMEQLTTAHTRARHEQQHSDKELKSMKKQVHKAELALIRCQAELEEARKEQEGFKMRADHERQAKEKSRQEAFERARTLASNIEELEVVKRERDLLVSENESLKSVQSSMHLSTASEAATEVREVGVQARLDTIQEHVKPHEEQGAYLCSKCGSADIPSPDPTESETMRELHEELTWVRIQLRREEDLVHFMNMQCQFRACPCRMAEKAGVRFVHDYAYDRRQQELVKAKGLKRKAEDELPLPKYITLRERLEQTSRERQEVLPHAEVPIEEQVDEQESAPEQEQQMDEPALATEAEEDTTLRALPERDSAGEDNAAGVISLDEAADIPLPSPRSDDLEPTALLEDITQVMVEPQPLTTGKHFTFSTSTASRTPLETETPLLRQSHSAMSVSAHDDLFDIAPPKFLPPRPSTVCGLRTVESPIRLVPPSPQHRESMTPTTSPPHRTMQVPLKDSPLRNSVTQRRSHSRGRDRSRVRSPTPGRSAPNTNSPAADTCFPVTPKQKNERASRTIPAQPHYQLQALHAQSSSQTTTTRVPLRGLDDDDVFSPQKPEAYDHAHTQALDTSTRGRQPLSENDPNTSAQPTMLPGTPISREAALAQIRARRDRARSVAMRKQTDEEGSRMKTPKSAARRGVMLNREMMGRDISNLSQASAPARF
ncbi:hypothetical protein PMZ80_009157 [Knufia obscura]|uniref:Uncharacterized protein n=2 Tax=Knufia TaxID=430999 RepID=A0AAN8EG93_9EURO|nr:hypothetical protein PMZ80_009157 [Knufia obscura]KAK5954888.1 hypothetical protein OHC33_003566 [Knufia fluminis]